LGFWEKLTLIFAAFRIIHCYA